MDAICHSHPFFVYLPLVSVYEYWGFNLIERFPTIARPLARPLDRFLIAGLDSICTKQVKLGCYRLAMALYNILPL